MMKGVTCRNDPEGYRNADQIMEQGLMLPCHPTMTEEDCSYLYQTIEDWIALQRNRKSASG